MAHKQVWPTAFRHSSFLLNSPLHELLIDRYLDQLMSVFDRRPSCGVSHLFWTASPLERWTNFHSASRTFFLYCPVPKLLTPLRSAAQNGHKINRKNFKHPLRNYGADLNLTLPDFTLRGPLPNLLIPFCHVAQNGRRS